MLRRVLAGQVVEHIIGYRRIATDDAYQTVVTRAIRIADEVLYIGKHGPDILMTKDIPQLYAGSDVYAVKRCPVPEGSENRVGIRRELSTRRSKDFHWDFWVGLIVSTPIDAAIVNRKDRLCYIVSFLIVAHRLRHAGMMP